MLTTIEKMLFLNRVDLFKDIPLDNLMGIAGLAKEQSYTKHTTLFHEGDEGESLYLIVKGSVGIIKNSNEKKKLIAVVEENQCVGEMAILTDDPRSTTVKILENSDFLVIDKKDFKTLIKQNPIIAFSIFKVLIIKLNHATEKLAQLTKED